MAGDDFIPPWYRDLDRIRREQEWLQRIAAPAGSMRAMIEAGEQMRSLGDSNEERRRMLEALSLSSASVSAARVELPDYNRIADTTIRIDASLLAGRAFHDMSVSTAGAYLSAMEDAQRAAVLGRSLVQALSLNEALADTYAAGISNSVAEIAASLESINSLRDVATSIGQFRAAIEIGTTQIDVPPALRRTLDGLDHITSAATSIWSGIAHDVERFSSLSAPLRELPVLYAFEATRAVAMLFSDDEEVVEARAPHSLVATRAVALPSMLERLHPNIAEKYRGVLHAIQTRGPDYIAQASASARELLKFTVEMLAPDDQVLAFKPGSERGQDGNLTRRARLDYIFRKVATSKNYAKMVDGQINLILASWFPLNTAVHDLAPDLKHHQLESLIIQIEFGLIEMLHASDQAMEI
jgi:hypothetical protein